VLTLVGGIGITLFEIFVGFLQAFIFTLLAAVYIQMSEDDAH
jgi:F-type H+-transporting ATPase subunit a